MSAYDEALYERDCWNSLRLSHRFMSNYHKFYGTAKVAVEMLLANTILESLPRSLGYFLLFFYIIVGLVLSFLITKSLWNPHQKNNYEDLDLVDVATYKRIYVMKGIYFALGFALLTCVAFWEWRVTHEHKRALLNEPY